MPEKEPMLDSSSEFSGKPISRIYSFDKLLSHNAMVESWAGRKLKNGQSCFLKIVAEKSPLGIEKANAITLKSVAYQSEIRSHSILRAFERHLENGRIVVEYPYLNPERWRSLAPAEGAAGWKEILVEVSRIVDLLHLLGFVHADLKLSNFQICREAAAVKLKLVDLDFLAKAQSPPGGLVFGTPGHIAPEILENEVVSIQSDNYSLGISLREYFGVLTDTGPDGISSEDRGKLAALTEALTAREQMLRPRSLIEALGRFELIAKDRLEAELKRLLATLLISRFREYRGRINKDPRYIDRFLREQCGLFGLPEDLTEDLIELYACRKPAAFRLFSSLIQNSRLNRFGDYRQIEISDDDLMNAFNQIARQLGEETPMGETGAEIDGKTVQAQIQRIEKMRQSGALLKPYLCLLDLRRGLAHHSDLANDPLIAKLDQELSLLAGGLGRTSEAEEHARSALGYSQIGMADRIRLMIFLGYQQVLAGHYREADDMFNQTLEIARTTGDKSGEIVSLRQKAWISFCLGNHADAERALGDLDGRARELNLALEEGKIALLTGYMSARRGDMARAEKYYLEALEHLKKGGVDSELILPLSNLAFMKFEEAKYDDAIRYGKLALKYCRTSEDRFKLPLIFVDIMCGHSRLGEHQKAEYWLQQYLTCRPPLYSRRFFEEYYSAEGSILWHRGAFRASRESFQKALEMMEPDRPNHNQGKISFSLAGIAIGQGEFGAAEEYLGQARSIFQKFSNKSALAEIRMTEGMLRFSRGEKEIIQELVPIFSELTSCRCHYYSALCLLYIFLYGTREMQQEALSMAPSFHDIVRDSKAPLFKALCALETGLPGEGSIPAPSLVSLKRAYQILMQGADYGNAFLVCRRIADIYLAELKPKLARKYLLQNRRLAEMLGNRVQAVALEREIEVCGRESRDQKSIIESVYSISEILKNLGNYDLALQKLVQYAVNETGAERGVLLLAADPSVELQIKAFVNCDDDSLKDIVDFSRSIVQTVAVKHEPILIDNALEDDRTRKYKSIVAHNILSVIGVPIPIRDRSVGVFYLDHHTIPALFEKDDVTFIYSMANFMSILLSAIQDFHGLEEKRRQLTHDLARAGIKEDLKTQNATMLALKSRIPEIAASSASILICGESGTGKEILCNMIHNQSRRAGGPLVKLNCAAVASSLVESELFGVEKDSATMVRERDGKFQAADGGTMFLDEIADMPLEVQAKVLRVLEDRVFEKVGSNRRISVDVRFISATNKNLEELIEQDKFREDLYYRINVIRIDIPPLREHADDIPMLIDHFLEIYAPDARMRPLFDDMAMEALCRYRWVGNVRELRNMVERYCILFRGMKVGLADLPDQMKNALKSSDGETRASEQAEKMHLLNLHRECRGNVSAMARRRRIPLSTLRRKLKKLEII